MSIYIPGMEMPTNCGACPFHKLWSLDDPLQCRVNLELWCDSPERHKLCPLIHVPEHGRLIGADALMENAQFKGTHDIVNAWDIVSAPTIISADKEGEGCH